MHKHPVSWWELASNNVKATAGFMRSVFEWDLPSDEQQSYYEQLAGAADNGFFGGGIYQNEEDGSSWLVLYITVDDVDAMAIRIEQHGGKILQLPFDVEGLGRICLFEEPSGQRLAIIKRAF